MHAAEASARTSTCALLLCGILALAASGCISASLATSTGPRVQGPWSVVNLQHAHVGEEVEFDFILTKPYANYPLDPMGIADYCVLSVRTQHLLTESEWGGHFHFIHTFDDVAVGDTVKVTASAYRTYGRQDVIASEEGWRERTPSGDERDARIARDSVTLKFYQTQIELEVDVPDGSTDDGRGRLVLRKPDGTVHIIPPARADRPGYVTTPATDGKLRVLYSPQAHELPAHGQAEIEFKGRDRAGNPITATTTIDAP